MDLASGVKWSAVVQMTQELPEVYAKQGRVKSDVEPGRIPGALCFVATIRRA
jgi:hypothetical protein